jgi:hypothetical protein
MKKYSQPPMFVLRGMGLKMRGSAVIMTQGAAREMFAFLLFDRDVDHYTVEALIGHLLGRVIDMGADPEALKSMVDQAIAAAVRAVAEKKEHVS